jgi:hypothetical protein
MFIFYFVAIRQAIAKSLVAYYQKCKSWILGTDVVLCVFKQLIAIEVNPEPWYLPTLISFILWTGSNFDENWWEFVHVWPLLSLEHKWINGQLSFLFDLALIFVSLSYCQTWMRHPKRKSKISLPSTIDHCWWLIPDVVKRRSLVVQDHEPATRSHTVKITVYILLQLF